MEFIWNKFSYDRAAVIEVAFSIATNCSQPEWLRPEEEAMSQAVDDIVFSLGGDEGLTFVEFEILAAYAARVDSRTQLEFLENLVDIIRASSRFESFSEYDQRFLDFVASIHNGLTVTRGANLDLYTPPGLPDANLAQHVHGQGPIPVDLIQATTSETTRTWKSEFQEVSEAGKYKLSVVETVTGDASMPGGAYSTMSTTSNFAEMTPERGYGEGHFCSDLEGMSGLKLESGAPSNLHVSGWDGPSSDDCF
ncbi:hypothetical protein FGADI_12425 [Fusarium gaditjirri]|uniref:Uncharacterized protein n=1 Tax=Fusarium gaditjirri TaxID=282569 RepID=A0A8H4SSK1_9HYPO|nr:hypothetical protein FGADI_12425 [Fusarium gaditjirri]